MAFGKSFSQSLKLETSFSFYFSLSRFTTAFLNTGFVKTIKKNPLKSISYDLNPTKDSLIAPRYNYAKI